MPGKDCKNFLNCSQNQKSVKLTLVNLILTIELDLLCINFLSIINYV